MKIMMLTSYIYDEKMPEFTRNQTGFGMMVRDILIAVSKLEEVVLVSRVITDAKNNHTGKYRILPHTWKQILVSAKGKDWICGFKAFFRTKSSLKNRCRVAFYYIDQGYVRKQIKIEKPDIVHIHGIGEITKSYIDICEELGIKYLVTLHGLIGLDSSVAASVSDKNMEREFLVKSAKEGIPVSVISSGMKRRIEERYLGHEAGNITVITNGTWIKKNNQLGLHGNIREQFYLPDGCKICVVIGSIIKRKNQIQIVEAFNILPENIKNNCAIFMCGTDMTNGVVENRIKQLNLDHHIFMLGFLNQSELSEILDAAYLNIVASLDEGFGLSIIEAYSHGVPTVSFSNLDAIADLYDPETMLLAGDRSTETLSDTIRRGLDKSWNKNYIKKYAGKFSLEKMAEKYVAVYKAKLSGGYLEIEVLFEYLWLCKHLGYKLIFYVANISTNKNQIQFVDIMNSLKYKEKVIGVLFGREEDKYAVRKKIKKDQLEEDIFLAGFCGDLSPFWKLADLNILLSVNEGFGLSIIEGYTNGVPSVLFEDLDAAQDISDEMATKLIANRKNHTIVDTVVDALNYGWHEDKIRMFGNHFSMENIANKYIELYRKLEE